MTLGERIKKVRKALNLTQQEFANQLGSKRNTIATYEIGRTEPSAAVISLVCTKFNVSETWLRAEEGEMFVQKNLHNEILAFLDKSLPNESPEFKQRFASVLSRLNTEQWEVLETVALAMVKDTPAKSPLDSDTAKHAELEREADEFAAIAREQYLAEKKQKPQALSAKESDVG